MSIIKLGKKNEKPACCGGSHTETGANPNNSRFIVLGACCKKSMETFDNVKQAVKELGFSDDVLNIGDPMAIARYGVMQTPGLVVDNKVISYGKLLKVEDVKKLFEKYGVK